MTRDSKIVKSRQPCPLPNCGSSDAFSYREDGTGFCFSCSGNYNPHPKIKEPSVTNKVTNLQKMMKTYRGIKPEVLDFFGVKLGCDDEGLPVGLVYSLPNGTKLGRKLESKEFWMSGSDDGSNPLFGSDKFSANGAKAITITEGFNDAMAVYQMHGSRYPTVGVRSAQSAKKELSGAAYDYINSFDKIYLSFDSDAPGQKAQAEVAKLFDVNKVYIVPPVPQFKDPHEFLEKGMVDLYVKAWWAAKRFLPEGILSSFSEFDDVFDKDVKVPSVPYPFPGLQDMTYGIRTGETVLITAMEGLGKTEIIRAIEYDLLKNTDANIGIIHLEENKTRTLKGIVNYETGTPVHLPEYEMSKDALKENLRKAITRDDRLHIYSHFGSDDPDIILSTIRYMAGACNCKYIFLDHITMVVSGLQGDNERQALDYISTQLAMMVEELDFNLHLISHVNDSGQTRGSRNISKIADIRLDLFRDITATDPRERNTTQVIVSKNRYSGKTGPACKLEFNTDTYVLAEQEETGSEHLPF